MATWELTPKNPDTITRLAASELAWQFAGRTFGDVFMGCCIISWRGWRPMISIDDSRPVSFPQQPFWVMDLQNPLLGLGPITFADTDWMAFNGVYVRNIPDATVQTDFTVTQWTGPTALGGTGQGTGGS